MSWTTFKIAVVIVVINLAFSVNGDKIFNGVTLFGTSVEKLNHDGAGRNVVVVITNHLHIPLSGGENYINWGYSRTPVRPQIPPLRREAFLFESARTTATGAAGCVAYTIPDLKRTVRFLIVFSVPYGYVSSSNWFGLKIISQRADIDQGMYYSAYYDDAWDNPSPNAKYGYARDAKTVSLTRENYTITATMTDKKRAVIKVDVFTIGGGYYNGKK